MAGAVPLMSCGGCGKSVPWKPEYAGKRLRCKCGFTIIGPPAAPANVAAQPANRSAPSGARAASPPQRPAAPKAPAPPAPTQSAADDPFDQLVAQAEEYQVADEPKPAQEKAKPAGYRRPRPPTGQPVAGGGGGGGAAVMAAPSSPMLAYARVVPKKPDEGSQGAMVNEIYIPVGFVLAGLVGQYIAAYVRGIHNPILMTVYVIITATIELFLIFSALMLAVKLLDLGLGSIGPALLKICAVALLPGAVGDMISYYSAGILGWGATLLMYYVLLIYLFDLDGQEMWITCVIIWGMKWVSFFILLALLASLGLHVRARGTGSRGGGVIISAANPTVAPPAPVKTPDQFMADEIRGGKTVEFREWIKPDLHGVNEGSRQGVAADCERYYAAGAKMVYAYDIEKRSKEMEICHEMIVELPKDAKDAAAVRKAIYGFDASESDVDDPNSGKRFIRIPLDRSAVRPPIRSRDF